MRALYVGPNIVDLIIYVYIIHWFPSMRQPKRHLLNPVITSYTNTKSRDSNTFMKRDKECQA